MRHKIYILIVTISTSCVFLIGCADRNDSPAAQTYPSGSNNPAPAWIVNGDYQAVKSFYDLPKDVRIAIFPDPAKYIRLDQMAEPNKPFNSTDAIIDDNLPMRRFITGGFSKDYAFVFYEHGGIGYNCPLVILKRNNDKADIIFFAYCWENLSSLDQLKSAINGSKIKEENDPKFWSR